MEIDDIKKASTEAVSKGIKEYAEALQGKASKEELAKIQKGIDDNLKKWEEKAHESEAIQKQLDVQSTEIKKLRAEGVSAKEALGMTMQETIMKALDTESEAFKLFKESPANPLPRNEFEIVNQKAVGTMTFGSNATGQVVDNVYVPGIVGTQRRRTRIRQFLSGGVTSGDAVPFVQQTGGEGAANVTDEGTAKSQADKDIQLVSAPVRKITEYIRVSDEMLSDLPALSSFLTSQAIDDVLDKEDQQLLYGTGSGTPTQLEGLTVATGVLSDANIPSAILASITAPQEVDAIYAAFATLAAAEYMADTVIINPVDYYKIVML